MVEVAIDAGFGPGTSTWVWENFGFGRIQPPYGVYVLCRPKKYYSHRQGAYWCRFHSGKLVAVVVADGGKAEVGRLGWEKRGEGGKMGWSNAVGLASSGKLEELCGGELREERREVKREERGLRVREVGRGERWVLGFFFKINYF